jgi:DNA-binding CsgD family transcriptional regulator/tetratricopeptide (TPR) repeat protein
MALQTAERLTEARELYARQAWRQAHEALSAADRSDPLVAADLELLATSAYMLGREQEYLQLLERAYNAHLEAGDPLAATRSAAWIAVRLLFKGEVSRAGGWVGRAQRLLEREGSDCVERGYLLIPRIIEHEIAGDPERAAATAAEAAAVGERYGDRDLFSIATHAQGVGLIGLGRLREGLALLDLAMVAVIAGEVSPVSSGIVYCGAILGCEEAHELRRAREWTTALTRWCEDQPDLVAFTGRCLVHRAQIMRLDGSWDEAIEEAQRAAERCLKGENPMAAGEACYQRGEVHRLRGEHAEAERAYREASGHGWEPQPGIALLRLAQGNEQAAEASIRRVVSETEEPGKRARLLPAYVEILIAVGDQEGADEGRAELDAIARAEEAPGALTAIAAQAGGLADLVAGKPQEALSALRRAAELWRQFKAPYENARVRELIGLALRDLGDEDGGSLELEAARETFARLGAATDLARVDGDSSVTDASAPNGLTKRELEVLRRLCAGETNREIAAGLVLSVRTVDRHVSNMYAKLGVSSRAAATTYAHEHGLI